jgi:hypothetical protein
MVSLDSGATLLHYNANRTVHKLNHDKKCRTDAMAGAKYYTFLLLAESSACLTKAVPSFVTCCKGVRFNYSLQLSARNRKKNR